MGAKQAKFEGSYLPGTPLEMKNKSHGVLQSNELDPRSPNPNVVRTPITFNRSIKTAEVPINNTTENPLGLLRKRILRGFVYNINDPRSPSAQLNRTPLIFDEAIDRTLNLNDTFADLFVETVAKVQPSETVKDLHLQINDSEMVIDTTPSEAPAASSEVSTESIHETENLGLPSSCEILVDEEETILSTAILRPTPAALTQQLDPRSPTIGVDRTPIIFNDDDEAGEDAFLENVLATLSLDMSNNSSVLSFGTPNLATSNEDKRLNHSRSHTTVNVTNRNLDRVRTGQKRNQRQRKITRNQRQRIYEDTENFSPMSTPKHKSTGLTEEKRTPLSCVKNRPNLRSRSVETSAKSLKARLTLTSFDDSLNPIQSPKITNLRILRNSQEPL